MTGDRFAPAGVLLVMLGCVLLAGYVAFLAPCAELGWMPVKDLPARCFERAP